MKIALPAILFFLSSLAVPALAQRSAARRWNEAILQSIREDFARPPVHARNLFHLSLAMYDAWAAYDTIAQPYMLGKTIGNFTCPFSGVPRYANIEASRDTAISYAAYRILTSRFANSPRASTTIPRLRNLMIQMGYDYFYTDTDYAIKGAAALGNYIGQCVLAMGRQDGSNDLNNYANQYYVPVNPPLVMSNPGNPTVRDPNRWQPLSLSTAVDQNGNPIPSVQVAQSSEWGNVQPFAMTAANRVTYQRDGNNYVVYNDPGPFPTLDTNAVGGLSEEFKWNNALVSVWGSHHDPWDGILWDISPAGLGNNTYLPETVADLRTFYNLEQGGDAGKGRPLNPKTGQPYKKQIVPRGDYTRVLAQYWADGPNSETPPGHWFSIFNYVSDQLSLVKRFNGKGEVLNNLEWDVKSYFTLGGALHDAAISAWGIKGWYDGTRPVAAIRYMAGKGQSSDPSLPSYHPAGIVLIPGKIELIKAGDPLAGNQGQYIGKIKLYSWRGNKVITNPATQIAGVGWILAENWEPYQRSTFVTPPFPGYISGHSTYSRAAAEAITLITGDEYFPGGLGEFTIKANTGFLGLEDGPVEDVNLQWATYTDAADQTSLSRIWGGIHPPFDDIPGRKIGAIVGKGAYALAKTYFYRDEDIDGYYSNEDCDDHNPAINPGMSEFCDGLDNNCNLQIDEGLPQTTFYRDADGDGFGSPDSVRVICSLSAPIGYVRAGTDCNDLRADIRPGAPELCDGLDNNCNGTTDEGVVFTTYFEDKDQDGFGNPAVSVTNCFSSLPIGFIGNNRDCDDANAAINPLQREVCDGVDNNCNGMADEGLPQFTFYRDADGDGFGTLTIAITNCQVNAPAGYSVISTDCNDLDASIYPGAPEICDNIDNNCNGVADEGLPQFTFYRDGDGDGFGTLTITITNCRANAPTGYSVISTDCNDLNASIYPGAPEICDNIDNNCNGTNNEGLPILSVGFSDRDGDGFGNIAVPFSTCAATLPAGYVVNGTDCNDQNAAIFPGQTEVWDQVDNDCDGSIDEGTVGSFEPEQNIRIYPNPVHDILVIELPWQTPVEIRLLDISGKVVVEKSVVSDLSNRTQLNCAALPAGIYLLQIVEANHISTWKVVRE